VNYTKLFYTSAEFDQVLEKNPFIKSSFDQKLIYGLTSTITYNGLIDTYKKHKFYASSNIELAGNSISLFDMRFGSSEKIRFLGVEYAQSADAYLDICYHRNL